MLKKHELLRFECETFIENGRDIGELVQLKKTEVDPFVAGGIGLIAASFTLTIAEFTEIRLMMTVSMALFAISVFALKAAQYLYFLAFMRLRISTADDDGADRLIEVMNLIDEYKISRQSASFGRASAALGGLVFAFGLGFMQGYGS